MTYAKLFQQIIFIMQDANRALTVAEIVKASGNSLRGHYVQVSMMLMIREGTAVQSINDAGIKTYSIISSDKR